MSNIGKFKKYDLVDKALLVRSRQDRPIMSSVLKKGKVMKSSTTGRHVLRIKSSKMQKVELTSENFHNDQFDHYIVVKNPNVSLYGGRFLRRNRSFLMADFHF